jgi:hypothetical protein
MLAARLAKDGIRPKPAASDAVAVLRLVRRSISICRQAAFLVAVLKSRHPELALWSQGIHVRQKWRICLLRSPPIATIVRER